MKKIFGLFILTIFLSANTHAQESVKEKYLEHKENRQELKKLLSAYDAENVTPVLLEKRSELESKISKEDKQAIAQLRNKIKAAKEQKKAEWETIKKENLEGQKRGDHRRDHQGEFRKGERRSGNHVREKHILEEADQFIVKQLLEKYGDDLKIIYESLENQRAQWRADKKEIVVSTMGVKNNVSESRHHRMRRHNKGHHNQRTNDEGMQKERSHQMEKDDDYAGFKKQHSGLRFLLMDVETTIETRSTENGSEMKIYPNPVSENLNIEYLSQLSNKIEIVILNATGRMVLKEKSKVEKGDNKIGVDVSNFNNGTYYLKVKQGKGEMSSTFSVIH